MCTLSERIERIKKLGAGQDYKQLLNEAFKILKNPVFMYDTNNNLMAYTEDVTTDDRFWNEMVTTGTFSAESQEFFKQEGFIDDMANAKVITFLISDRLKYERITGKIFNKNKVHVANLTIVACEKAFAPEDAAVFEALCGLFSNKVSASKFYQDYENTYQEELIKKLIDRSIVDKELYAAHISILYGGFKNNLFVAVMDFSRCKPEYDKLAYFVEVFRGIQPRFKYAIYDDRVVAVISSANADFDIKKDLGKLYGIIKRKNIYAGISGCFENIYELPAHYSDAVKALGLGLASNSDKQFYLYDKIKEGLIQ